MRSMRTFCAATVTLGLAVGCSQNPGIRTPADAQGPQNRNGMQAGKSADPDSLSLARTASAKIDALGSLDVAATIKKPMPTGVAVSRSGRLFVCFPRWGDPIECTVAEIRGGKPVAFPNAEINRLETGPALHLVSVQSVVVDEKDRLWLLDTGSINMQPVSPGAPKLLCVDLSENRIIKTINFPENVALRTTYLNDVRFDLARGQEGMAFITDSSDKGPNGIIVVDLASGHSWRKLNDHPSTKADVNFVPTVEGQPLMARPGKGASPASLKIGADGIAIDPKKGVLYYCPLASRRLHSVSLDALADEKKKDSEVAETVKDLPARDFASDGLECDRGGALYLTDYENNAIRRFNESSSRYDVVVSDPRMIWPDSMAFGPGGDLYFTANQLNRQPKFHEGLDRRKPPYVVFHCDPGGTGREMSSR